MFDLALEKQSQLLITHNCELISFAAHDRIFMFSIFARNLFDVLLAIKF